MTAPATAIRPAELPDAHALWPLGHDFGTSLPSVLGYEDSAVFFRKRL